MSMHPSMRLEYEPKSGAIPSALFLGTTLNPIRKFLLWSMAKNVWGLQPDRGLHAGRVWNPPLPFSIAFRIFCSDRSRAVPISGLSLQVLGSDSVTGRRYGTKERAAFRIASKRRPPWSLDIRESGYQVCLSPVP
jgi:hypothetical protein